VAHYIDPRSTMVNIFNLWFKAWDDNNLMKSISKQIKKSNSNKPNIEGWKLKKKLIKSFFDKSDLNKPILMTNNTLWAWIIFYEHKEEKS